MESALVITLPGDVEMTFQYIPHGEFRMGARGYYDDEEPVHLVRITQPFYLGTYPVTQEQFAAFRSDHENDFANRPSHPAENLTWDDALAFCKWLTESCPKSLAGRVAVLPSEAQWEYACRAGTETEYYTGDGEAALAAAAWYRGNSHDSTHPVGLLQPNDFGLFDMHGNVWEWCRDAWDEHAYKHRIDGVSDPEFLGDDGSDRVFRGGSWGGAPGDCRAAYRDWGYPAFRFRFHGFRVCLVSGRFGASELAEPESVGVARRDDAAQPQRTGAAADDLSDARFPPRNEE